MEEIKEFCKVFLKASSYSTPESSLDETWRSIFRGISEPTEKATKPVALEGIQNCEVKCFPES